MVVGDLGDSFLVVSTTGGSSEHPISTHTMHSATTILLTHPQWLPLSETPTAKVARSILHLHRSWKGNLGFTLVTTTDPKQHVSSTASLASHIECEFPNLLQIGTWSENEPPLTSWDGHVEAVANVQHGKPLLPRYFRPALRIVCTRSSAPSDGLHASQSAPAIEVTHIEPKHLLKS